MSSAKMQSHFSDNSATLFEKVMVFGAPAWILLIAVHFVLSRFVFKARKSHTKSGPAERVNASQKSMRAMSQRRTRSQKTQEASDSTQKSSKSAARKISSTQSSSTTESSVEEKSVKTAVLGALDKSAKSVKTATATPAKGSKN